ncbi:hypothetical protein NUW58_g1583 [Xylaria curta]|uniref:Uncharacterized protein n=1 Tax=Xylaria curta TaxID=42375 RepID=A0ACC1PM45_9PEZI|nr:hypothetical protein NUW58_g1583 [Xylaria curta]
MRTAYQYTTSLSSSHARIHPTEALCGIHITTYERYLPFYQTEYDEAKPQWIVVVQCHKGSSPNLDMLSKAFPVSCCICRYCPSTLALLISPFPCEPTRPPAKHPESQENTSLALVNFPRSRALNFVFHARRCELEQGLKRDRAQHVCVLSQIMSRWLGQPSIKGSSESSRMALLTLSTIGITFVWGVEQTYCTPYLLSLGLTKSKTSLVWIAGPLSGLIVQPIVGTVADRSTSKWGRRRPFILTGAIISALFLLLLGFTEEIVRFFVQDKRSAQQLTVYAAVLAIYAVDFSINAVMSATRSLVVDTLPIEKQQTGSAWGSRMSAIGHGIAFAAGAVDLPSLFGKSLGETQFKQLTTLAAVGLVGTCSITCWAVSERVLLSTPSKSNRESGLYQVVSHIWSTILHLPPRIRAICMAQFWAWIGWFPFLFYSTTWIGETYFRYDAPHNAKQSADALGEVGRAGSQAFIFYSLITFSGSWFLPLIIKSPDDQSYTQRPPQSIRSMVEKFSKYKPDLLTAWVWAHATFASAMLFAPFAKSFKFAAVLVCICGLPWNIASWAPHAFLGVEVNKLSSGEGGSYRRLSNASVEMADMNGGLPRASVSHERSPDESHATAKSSSAGEPSGVYFGILNIYTTIPQFIGTIISSIVFSILEPGKSPELAHGANPDEQHKTDGPNGVAVCLFIGALSAIAAVFATRKLKVFVADPARNSLFVSPLGKDAWDWVAAETESVRKELEELKDFSVSFGGAMGDEEKAALNKQL